MGTLCLKNLDTELIIPLLLLARLFNRSFLDGAEGRQFACFYYSAKWTRQYELGLQVVFTGWNRDLSCNPDLLGSAEEY
uniref:Putative secreted protein n=1 Tax=Amblyomma cajennense TaxID=34607 RepID=A0A023FDF6_AMBCJ